MDLRNLAKQVEGLHRIVGAMAGLPELFLSEEESFAVAQAVSDVSREYKIKLDPKYTVLINAAVMVVMVYAPRVVAITARLKSERAQKEAEQAHREQTVAAREDRPIVIVPPQGPAHDPGV